MTERARGLAAFLLFAGGAAACHGLIPTRTLVGAFNQGMLDSRPDPYYSPERRGEDVVARQMRDELMGGYFGQGAPNARVAGWLRVLSRNADAFMSETLTVDEALATTAAPASESPTEARGQRVERSIDLHCDFVPIERPLCRARHDPDGEAVATLADYIRFRTSALRAVGAAGALLDERLATAGEAARGAKRAFDDTASYLEARRWRRELDRPITGLVVKGGAATGIYSAGVVWVALNILEACVREGACDRASAGFALMSGTSTGATIVGAVDRFQTELAAPDGDPGSALLLYEQWYLCSSMDALYCVRNGSAVNLARGEGAAKDAVQDSMLDFLPLAKRIEDHYRCRDMNNRSELVLNAVDFRTGRLYSLSDQDRSTLRSPWDVTKAIISSAALPFIVRPIYDLPVDPLSDAGSFAYLDGGIRSELPVLSLVRRGVERVLVVSSDASVMGESAPISNAASMAIRYIGVSTGGITEAEIDHARTRAEAGRLAEHEACMDFLKKHDQDAILHHRTPLCTGVCDRDAVCSGDFAAGCDRVVAPPAGNGVLHNAEVVEKTWRMTNVWRDELRVPGLPGYAFDPAEQRRLMLAGAEAARQKCEAIASSLGIEVGPKVTKAKLYEWCTRPLKSNAQVCGQAVVDAAKQPQPAGDCGAPIDPSHPGPQPTPGGDSTKPCTGAR